MKDMLREMANDVKSATSSEASASEVTSFMAKAKRGSVANEDIFKFAKLFKVSHFLSFLCLSLSFSLSLSLGLPLSFSFAPLCFILAYLPCLNVLCSLLPNTSFVNRARSMYSPFYPLSLPLPPLKGRFDAGQHVSDPAGDHVHLHECPALWRRRVRAVQVAVPHS